MRCLLQITLLMMLLQDIDNAHECQIGVILMNIYSLSIWNIKGLIYLKRFESVTSSNWLILFIILNCRLDYSYSIFYSMW